MPTHERGAVLVTGASRGIGAATAALLARPGYAVAVNFRAGRDDAEAVVASIVAQGGRAAALQADVSDESQVERMFEQRGDRLGPLTGLVNNAGILELQSPLLSMRADRLQRIFATNVIGTIAAGGAGFAHGARGS